MSRVETLRRMGLDWAADLIESLMMDKARLRVEVARLKRTINEIKAKK